jgi:hypothetical protein
VDVERRGAGLTPGPPSFMRGDENRRAVFGGPLSDLSEVSEFIRKALEGKPQVPLLSSRASLRVEGPRIFLCGDSRNARRKDRGPSTRAALAQDDRKELFLRSS